MVIWITGISGAGKTTLAKHFKKKFKKKLIYFDGDEFRKIFNNDIKYTLKSRNTNAERLTKLVKYLSDQKNNLIIAANLTSYKYRVWCRKNIKDFIEVFIVAEINSLIKRDYKKLYSDAIKKKINNVVGIDIPFKIPKGSNIYITNNGTKLNFLSEVKTINKYIKKNKIKYNL
jgi:cytidine diphosphoramidate kinase